MNILDSRDFCVTADWTIFFPFGTQRVGCSIFHATSNDFRLKPPPPSLPSPSPVFIYTSRKQVQVQSSLGRVFVANDQFTLAREGRRRMDKIWASNSPERALGNWNRLIPSIFPTGLRHGLVTIFVVQLSTLETCFISLSLFLPSPSTSRYFAILRSQEEISRLTVPSNLANAFITPGGW